MPENNGEFQKMRQTVFGGSLLVCLSLLHYLSCYQDSIKAIT